MGIKRSVLTVGSILALTVLFATSVSASVEDTKNTPISVSIEAGGGANGALNLQTSPIQVDGFGTITLTKDQTTYQTGFSGDFEVTDLRGSHEGWALQLTAEPLTSEDGNSVLTKALTIAGLQGISSGGTGSGGEPTIGINTKRHVDGDTIPIATAEQGKGMGVFNLTFPEDALELTVSARTAKAGIYTTDLNWNLLNAPQ